MRYIFDPSRMLLIGMIGNNIIGGWSGHNAEEMFFKLLDTDADIRIGKFQTVIESKLAGSNI